LPIGKPTLRLSFITGEYQLLFEEGVGSEILLGQFDTEVQRTTVLIADNLLTIDTVQQIKISESSHLSTFHKPFKDET
jgi:hypothetical protein